MPLRGSIPPKEGQVPEQARHKGGAGKCATCFHPEVEAINQAIVSGIPMAKIAKQYGMAKSSLQAHKKNHLSPAYKAIQEGKAGRVASGDAPALDQLKALLPTLKNALHWAQGAQDANGNFTVLPNVSQVLAAVRELRATIELLAKITGELDDRPTTVINILTTEAWLQTRRNIIEALQPFPEARLAVANRLMLQEGNVIEGTVTSSDVPQAAAGDAHGG